MAWVAVFWIVYGVGSTLFVVYLFRIGKSVASNRKDLLKRELEEMRAQDAQAEPEVVLATESSAHTVKDKDDDSVPANRLQVHRIFQPDENYVAVQGVRDGATCLINLPVGQATDALRLHAGTGAAAEKAV